MEIPILSKEIRGQIQKNLDDFKLKLGSHLT